MAPPGGGRPTPPRRRLGWILLAGLLVVAGCGISPAVGTDLTPRPFGADVPPAETLERVARDRAEEMCDARRVAELRRPGERYVHETWSEVRELVGRARLQGRTPGARGRARAEAEQGWDERGSVRLERWDARGSGEVACGDGALYVVTVLGRRPDPDGAAPPRHADDEVRARLGIPYRRGGDGADGAGGTVLDVYAPPSGGGGRNPVLVLVHGGGFVGGSRLQHRAEARAWARRGFITVTVDYRLDPDVDGDRRATRGAARRALDDVRDAVRWVRANAKAWEADPDRIAVLGASAGGQLALGLALLDDDAADGGPHEAESATVSAAFSTGAFLDPVLDLNDLRDDTAPVLVHHFESDTVSGRAWSSAGSTCDAVRGVDGTCDLSVSPGADHTVGLGPLGPMADEVVAFLSVHLGLDG